MCWRQKGGTQKRRKIRRKGKEGIRCVVRGLALERLNRMAMLLNGRKGILAGDVSITGSCGTAAEACQESLETSAKMTRTAAPLTHSIWGRTHLSAPGARTNPPSFLGPAAGLEDHQDSQTDCDFHLDFKVPLGCCYFGPHPREFCHCRLRKKHE